MKKSKSQELFCSLRCRNLFLGKIINKNCACCGKDIIVQKCRNRDNNFCSMSCHGTHSTRSKKHGIKRSKLEILIEKAIGLNLPSIGVLYSDLSAIGSELDIFIPSLSLAFEINGIFHYKPIFGEDKLQMIKNNDEYKRNCCIEKNIKLVYIDTSSLTHTNEKKAAPFIEMVLDLIRNHMI